MNLLRTFKIIIAALREQVQAERAYPANVVAEFLSVSFYTVIFVIFIELLFERTGLIAGFSKNDFMFMFLVSQISFYVIYSGVFTTMARLIEFVRTGSFDLLLLKPVPARTYFYASSIRPLSTLITTLPTIIFLAAIINWSQLHLTLPSVLGGIIVWGAGLIIYNTLLFALTLPVFKVGEATDVLNTFYNLDSLSTLPYSKLPTVMKGLSLILLPGLIMTAAATDVMLMKSDPSPILISCIVASLFSLLLLHVAWRWALKHYTSASS